MGDPLTLLVYLLVIALVLYLVFWVINQMGLPQPVRVVVLGIIGIIAIVWLLQRIGFFL